MIYLLDFIYSQKKREELENILFSHHPNHNQRIYLISFLNSCCNMTKQDVDKLIKNHAKWDDYTEEVTDKHTASICHEPRLFSEDFSSVADYSNNKPQYKKCQDNSVFSKLNRSFFDIAQQTAWEYDVGKYNIFGKMSWCADKHPIYRSIEDKNGLLLYLDLDCTDIKYGWEIAKRLYNLDNWSTFKYSGSRGFHLCKLFNTNHYQDLKEQAEDYYNSIKTNLISFGRDKNSDKPVNIDTSSFNRNRLVRGYCLNLKSRRFSIPVNEDQTIEEIIDISSDINKVKQYLET